MGAKKWSENTTRELLVSAALRPHLQWDKIAIREKISSEEVISEAINQKATHICQTSHPYFVEDLNVAALMLGRPDIFNQNPIGAILDTVTASESTFAVKNKIFEFDFDSAKQKIEVLGGIEEVLSKKSTSSSIVSDVVIIADELFTNAVYNAPFVDLANTLPGASREDQNIKMHNGKSAKIFMGADTNRLVIGCIDPYGRLNMMKLFSRIHKCYNSGVAKSMNMSGGGVGIGSFMVYNASTSYFVAVEENVSTMICCVLPLKMSNRIRLDLPKNLHYILKK